MKSNSNKIKKLLLIVLIFFVMISIIPRAKNIWILSDKRDKLLQEKGELTLQNQDLVNERAVLESPAMVEKMARERLGMTKDGEKIIVPKK